MERFSRQALLAADRARFVHETEVAFQHVDAAGIVFFARVFDYFHDAYVAFLATAGEPLHVTLASGVWAAPLTHAEADYLAPLRFGDRVEVGIVDTRVDGSKATFGWRIQPVGGGPARAVGVTAHMFVDRATFQRAPIPERLAAAITALGAASS